MSVIFVIHFNLRRHILFTMFKWSLVNVVLCNYTGAGVEIIGVVWSWSGYNLITLLFTLKTAVDSNIILLLVMDVSGVVCTIALLFSHLPEVKWLMFLHSTIFCLFSIRLWQVDVWCEVGR